MDRHIEILLLDNDCVIVPGLGGFVAHYEPARLDTSDNTFIPPFRSIGFNQKLTLNDSLLAQSYVEAYDMSYPDALKRIEDEVRELRQRLDTEGCVTFDDLGELRLNDDGHLEFDPCEAGILTPELYGLSGFCMKPLIMLTSPQAVDASGKPLLTASPSTVIAADSPQTRPMEDNGDEETGYVRLRISWIRNILLAAAAILAFLFLPSRLDAPAMHPMESGIDTGLLLRVIPKNVTTGETAVKKAAEQRHDSMIRTERHDSLYTARRYTLVLAARITKKNAESYAAELQRKGLEAEVYRDRHGVKVVYGHYATKSNAQAALNQLRGNQYFNDAWLMQFQP